MAWWNNNYAYRRAITIPARSGGYAIGDVVSVPLETRALFAEGNLRLDRKDLRVVLDDATELDRILTDTATILFRVQRTIPTNVADSTSYSVYYGYAAESTNPPEDRRNVYKYYYDGYDIASLTTTGTITAWDMPKPRFIKNGGNPVFTGSTIYGVRDIWGHVYENGTHHLWFAKDAMQGYATTTDLYNFTDHTPYDMQPVNPPTPPMGVAAFSPQFQMDNGKWLALTVHSGPSGFGALGLPQDESLPWWISATMQADTLAGPWTLLGIIVPGGQIGGFNGQEEWERGSMDEATTSAGSIWKIGAKYYLLHGTGAAGPYSRGAGLASADTPTQVPYVKDYVEVLNGDTEQIENVTWKYDSDSGYYYLWAVHAGIKDDYRFRFDHLVSQVLYWTTDITTWNVDNKTTILEPTFGAWDELISGLPSRAVVRDGVCVNFYDGCNIVKSQLNGLDWNHSGGYSQSLWPFPWGKAIRCAAASTLETPTNVLVGDGAIKAKVRFPSVGNHGFGIKTVSAHWAVMPPATGLASDYFLPMRWDNNGSITTASYARIINNGKTVEFRRSGSNLKVIVSGWQIFDGTISTSDLKAYSWGDVVIEEMWVEPTIASTTVGAGNALTVSYSVVAGVVSLSGHRASGVEVVVQSNQALVGSVNYPSLVTWTCDAVLAGGTNTITVTSGSEQAIVTIDNVYQPSAASSALTGGVAVISLGQWEFATTASSIALTPGTSSLFIEDIAFITGLSTSAALTGGTAQAVVQECPAIPFFGEGGSISLTAGQATVIIRQSDDIFVEGTAASMAMTVGTPSIAVATASFFKVQDQSIVLKVWNGQGWDEAPLKYWNRQNWQQ